MNARPQIGGAVPVLAVLAAGLVFSVVPSVAGVAVAIACLIWRPRAGGWLGWLLLGLAALPLLALLPASWFGDPGWRSVALAGEVPLCVTPQPLALLSAWVSYLSGLVFLWWVCGRSGDGGDGHRQAAALVVAVAMCGFLLFARWESGAWRGPLADVFGAIFDTRNQAATFAALGICGCAVRAAATGAMGWRVVWGFAACLCVAAVVSLGSRGGALAAAVGCMAGWGILAAARWKLRQGAALTGAAVVAVCAVVLLLPSAPLVARFGSEGGGGLEFRLAVQSDALAMLAAHPVSGVGLGSFDGVFPFFRSLSASIWRTIHPESDWLWFACEAGLLAGFLAVGVAVILVMRWWHLLASGETTAPAVGLGCLAALAVHGLLDVPAHSGPVWFLAVALVGVGAEVPFFSLRPRLIPVFVGLALAAMAIGQAVWTPQRHPQAFSAAVPVDRLPDRLLVEEWMQFRPLDVSIVELAAHHAIRSGDRALARKLLLRLFALEPFSPVPVSRAMGVAASQGEGDLAVLCAGALIARAPAMEQAQRLNELLAQFAGDPAIFPALLATAPASSALQAVRIEHLKAPVSRSEFELFVSLASRPDDQLPTEREAARVLRKALENGYPEMLDPAEAMPALRRAARRAEAEFAASRGDFQSACEIVLSGLAPATDRIEVVPASGGDAYGLTMQALAVWRKGDYLKARTLLIVAVARPGAPPLAWFLLGDAEYRAAAYGKAWEAFSRHLSAGDTPGSAP